MIAIGPSGDLPWLAGRIWNVQHGLGPGVAICRVDVPDNAVVTADAVGKAELARAGRMRDPLEALRFLASHAVLRSVLAAALGRSRSRLELITDELGKARLVGNPLRFNMSRSGPALLVGISEIGEIGVDIELARALPDCESLARTQLSRREYESWCGGDAASSGTRFLGYWTRKEACAKAAGAGLAISFACIEAGCATGSTPVAVSFRSGRWAWSGQVVSLGMPPGLVAAAAVSAC